MPTISKEHLEWRVRLVQDMAFARGFLLGSVIGSSLVAASTVIGLIIGWQLHILGLGK